MSGGKGPRSVIYDPDGHNPLIGQQASSGSLPVVFANDQTPLTVTGSTGLLVGGQPVSSTNPLPITGSFTISAVFSGTLSSTITGSVKLTEPITGSVGITSPVAVLQGTVPWVISGSNWIPAITGSVKLSEPVVVSNFPAVQIVTGSVGLTGPITGSVGISGPVAVSNFPAVQSVTGSVGLSGPVTGTVKLSEAPTVNQGTSPWIISGSNWSPTINQGTTPWQITGSVGIQGPVLTAGTDGTGAVIPIRTDASGNLTIFTNSTPAGSNASIAFGDITVAAPGTYSIRRTTYTEQSANFQGSVKSSVAADAAAGTGARTVRITYLTSTGVGPLTEDVTLNGVTPVNLVNANHCFIEKIEVLTVGSGLVNAGTITLNAGLAGAGTVVGTIAVGNNQTFWCHHYTPIAKTTFVAGTLVANSSTVVGGGCTFALRAQQIPAANQINKQVGDTFTLYGQSSQTPRNFTTAVPLAVGPARLTMYAIVVSSTSIVYRASFDFYDQ